MNDTRHPRVSALQVSLALAAICLSMTARAQDTMRYLDNGRIRVGIDLAMGGAITYLSKSGTTDNIVNSHDAGREIQQSYYSGPNDFGWWNGQPWPWNPISVGDQWGNYSQVLEFQTDGTTLYTKIIPMQWGGSNPAGTPGDCTFENWVTLDGNVVRVRNRLNNQRLDRHWYGHYPQELPAIYTIGRLYRLWTYNGVNPFAGEPPVEMPNGFMWVSWRATEGWAAQLDPSGWGLGVFIPKIGSITGGFYPEVNPHTILAGPRDDPTGYMAPNHIEILDWNIVYEFSYDLILGTLDEIRAHAYANRWDPLPHWVFQSDRAHWTYNNARDTGWPIQGRLVVDVGRLDPMLTGPHCGFRAADCPTITVRMAARMSNPEPGWLTGQLFWERENGALPFSEAQSIRFAVINDGQFHNYTLNVGLVPTWTGFISRLRFDPVVMGRPGDQVEIAWISCRPTTMTVQDAAGRIGETVGLTATLTQAGSAVKNRSVAFSVNGTDAGSGLTDASGTATLPYAIPEAIGTGSHTVTAAFAGDDLYAPSSSSGLLSVSHGSTSMYVVDREGIITTPTILRAFLYRLPGNVGIAGRSVAFTVAGTNVGSAITEASGHASLNWIIDVPSGYHTIQAAFAGDSAYDGSTGTGTLTAQTVATKMVGVNRTAQISAYTVLRAWLYRFDNVPVPGKSVSFLVDGTLVGSAITQMRSGLADAQLGYIVPDGAGAGVRTIVANWAGDGGYLPSSATNTLTAQKTTPYIWVMPRTCKVGTPVSMYAYFRRLPDYQKQGNKPVDFRVDGTLIHSMNTDDNGVAYFIHRPTQPVGSYTIRCEFAGDAWVNPGFGEATLNVVP